MNALTFCTPLKYPWLFHQESLFFWSYLPSHFWRPARLSHAVCCSHWFYTLLPCYAGQEDACPFCQRYIGNIIVLQSVIRSAIWALPGCWNGKMYNLWHLCDYVPAIPHGYMLLTRWMHSLLIGDQTSRVPGFFAHLVNVLVPGCISCGVRESENV